MSNPFQCPFLPRFEKNRRFSKPEWIEPENYIEKYIAKYEKGWIDFKSIVAIFKYFLCPKAVEKWEKEWHETEAEFPDQAPFCIF